MLLATKKEIQSIQLSVVVHYRAIQVPPLIPANFKLAAFVGPAAYIFFCRPPHPRI